MSNFGKFRFPKQSISSAPTQVEVQDIITDELIGSLAESTQVEGVFSVKDIDANEEYISRFEKQHCRQQQLNQANTVLISIMQVCVAYQARNIGLKKPLHEQWLNTAFKNLSLIGRDSPWYRVVSNSIPLVIDYYRSSEEKALHVLELMRIGNNEILLQSLCSTITRGSFRIKKLNVLGELLMTQKCMKHCQSSFLQHFHDKGLSQSEEDAVFKISLLTYALNSALSFSSSDKQTSIARKALFEHQAGQMVCIFRHLMALSERLFGGRVDRAHILIVGPFRKLLQGFKDVNYKFGLFACPQALLCETMMVSMMFMAGVQIPLDAAEEDKSFWKEKVERVRHEDEKLLLPFISQSYAMSKMGPFRGNVKLQDFVGLFEQHLFQTEEIIIKTIPFHLQGWPIKNIEFLFHKMYFLMKCPLELKYKLRVCIYYLFHCCRLDRPNQQGMAVLRHSISSSPNEAHLHPKEKSLTKAIKNIIRSNPNYQRKMLRSLIDLIEGIDTSIGQYLRKEDLDDNIPMEKQLRQKLNLICSFDCQLFNKSGPLSSISQAQQHLDLYNFIQQHKKFSGMIATYRNSFIEGNGLRGQFKEYQQSIQQCPSECKLEMDSMQMARRHIDEGFIRAQASCDPKGQMRELGRLSVVFLNYGFLIHYCLIALKDYLTPFGRQRVLEISYQQGSQIIINEVIQILGADEAMSTILLPS